MPPAVCSMPLTSVLAKAEPGSVGSVICRPPLLLREETRVVALPVRAVRTRGTQGR